MSLRQAAQQALEALERINAIHYLQDLYEALDWEIEALRAALAEPERKPLSEDEIIEIVRALWSATPARTTPIDVAREIERAHGIGEQHGS